MAREPEGEGSRGGSYREDNEAGKLTLETPGGTVEVETHECVYTPAEDTALAIRALYRLARSGRRYSRIVDVGTGTGVLALVAGSLFKPRVVAAVDLSPYAVKLASSNLGPDSLVVRCDGLSCFNVAWDLAILNPPYLPVDPEEYEDSCGGWLSRSWSGGGGALGRLVREVAERSREVLIVYSSISPVDVIELLSGLGYVVEVLEREGGFFFEELRVVWGVGPGG